MNRKEILYIFLGVGKPIVLDSDLDNIEVWLEHVRNSSAGNIISLMDRIYMPRDNVRAILYSKDRIEDVDVNLKLLFVFDKDNITLSSYIEPEHADLIKGKISRIFDTEWAYMQTATDSLLIQTKHLAGIQLQRLPQNSTVNKV